MMWFDSSWQIVRVLVAATVGYAALVILLRASGKRTLAKLNAFDLVVTVALGSILATIALSPDVAVAEGVGAVVALVALQHVVAFCSSHSRRARGAIKSKPVAIAVDGELLVDVMRGERLSPDEVDQALRNSGVGGLELVAAVVMETDGSLSVVARDRLGSGSALRHVEAPHDFGSTDDSRPRQRPDETPARRAAQRPSGRAAS